MPPPADSSGPAIFYCHCQYAQVIPKEVKEEVLRRLCEAGIEFQAVADLCELSARADGSLAQIAGGKTLKIAACFPRAIKWLFHQAGAPLPIESTQVVNMRTETADAVYSSLLNGVLTPNLPKEKITAKSARELIETPVADPAPTAASL